MNFITDILKKITKKNERIHKNVLYIFVQIKCFHFFDIRINVKSAGIMNNSHETQFIHLNINHVMLNLSCILHVFCGQTIFNIFIIYTYII